MKTTPSFYPPTRRDDTQEEYFGTQVADPYRWLEEDHAPETARWVTAQNQITHDCLSQIPYRNQIKTRLSELWNYPKYTVPQHCNEDLFFLENDGLQQQSLLYVQRAGEVPQILLDPNRFSSDGTVALGDLAFSPDFHYLAYSVAEAGSDWVEIRVLEVTGRVELPDRIRWVKFCTPQWFDQGFYYSSYREPTPEEVLSGQNRYQRVMYHRLGSNVAQDPEIYSDPEHPLRYFHAEVSRDHRQLFIRITEGTSGTAVLFRNLAESVDFHVLFPGFEFDYTLVYANADRAVFHTNADAPNHRLLEVDFSGDKPVIRELLPASERLLEGASVVGEALFARYLDQVHTVVEQYDRAGCKIREVVLPGIGTVSGFEGRDEDSFCFFSYTGFTTPTGIYRYDLSTGHTTPHRLPPLPFDPDRFVTEQHFVTSSDGAQIPLFLVRRCDLKPNRSTPLYLYGYGGFNISLTPAYSPLALFLMEQGGIYVVANLRGGGEYGETWHRAGMRERKQRVFDDFIATAEYLIAKGYTSSERLTIAGGSNGGLLVGACMTQRPELFAVALPAVGVLDMLRFQRFTVGWGWVVEYGSSDRRTDFDYLYRYSPLHRLRSGVCYPATLITTGDHDDRVVPAHSFKFAATLQTMQGDDRPVLIRIDTAAGHGAGKPISKKIDEQSDQLAFLLWHTGTRTVTAPINRPSPPSTFLSAKK